MRKREREREMQGASRGRGAGSFKKEQVFNISLVEAHFEQNSLKTRDMLKMLKVVGPTDKNMLKTVKVLKRMFKMLNMLKC